jgi:hypothetical protein
VVKRLLVWVALALPVYSAPPALDHIVLVDVSGSMRTRGYSTAEAWGSEIPALLNKLLEPRGSYFSSESQLLLRPFSDPATDEAEKRSALGPTSLDRRQETVGQMKPPGAGATDMSKALDIGQQLASTLPHKALIWLLTDNENNFTSNQSDKAFYERLRDSPDYSHVFLFPLADPAKRAQDSLVMYLLVPPDSLEMEQVNALAREVEQRTGFGGMLFRPLYQQAGSTTLDFSKELTLEAPGKHRVEQEGGQTVLYFNEGDKLQGELRFRIRSRLKGWKVQGASLEDAEVALHVPPTYVDGSESKLRWQVTPKTLEVEPEKDSMTLFSLQIAGPGGKPIRLHRSTAQVMKNPFARNLPEVEGDVKMRAVLHVDQGDLQPQVPPEMQARLKTVPRLAEVEQYMLQQADATSGGTSGEKQIDFQRKLVVRVKADPTSSIVLGLLLAGAVLAGAGALAAALLWKSALHLEGPGVDEEFSLSGLAGSYTVCDGKGQPHCRLQSRWGSLSLVAEPDYEFEDELKRVPVRWEGDEFRFEVGQEGKPRDVFWLRRRGPGGGSAGGGSESPL